MEVEREVEHHYSPGYPRDLLQRFADGSSLNERPETAAHKAEDVSDEIELSLGLSLNGSFGVDPKRTKLIRSSSASLPRELDFAITAAAAAPPLARTYSLPVESEEEHRKRKELQSLKRLEAKRKREEKRRSAARPDEHAGAPPARQLDVVFPPLGRPGSGGGGGQYPPPVRQGSIGSQCSSSSGASNLDGRQAAATGGGGGDEKQQLRRTRSAATAEMEEMPCVTTRGEGPNGRRIEGFLYKYRKGEEVRIVCVCHGSFLTPAEFVRHAGGGEVVHPLRHIVISSSSPSTI